jgi:hypothetical protein
MTGRWWSAPAYLILGGLVLVLAFLLIPLVTDGSYSCRGSALEDVINPEPQESTAFRANFFDPAWVCNHRAQHRAERSAAAFGVFVAAGVACGLARRRRVVD